jgi:hypothetical protein
MSAVIIGRTSSTSTGTDRAPIITWIKFCWPVLVIKRD